MPPIEESEMPPARRDMGLTTRRGLIGSVARFWSRTFAPDYVALVFLTIGYIVLALWVEPFHRLFALDDINLSYPHALEERVPVIWNVIWAGIMPFALLGIWLAVAGSSSHKAQVTILGLLIALMLSAFITDSIKNAVGRPRPDLIARCKPKAGTPEHALVTIEDCTETDHHILQDGWRSFPSGHASFAFAGLGYLTLFFCGQLFVFRPRTDLPKALLALFPLLLAAWIAISRCQDYRHDVYDVTCGAILGIAVAHFSYRRYWPSLKSPRCDVPYSSKAMHDDGFGRIRGDEEARPQQSQGGFDLEDIDSSDDT